MWCVTITLMGIIDFTKERLNKTPITYTLTFFHTGKGMSFHVSDVQDTEKDRLAVAKDLEDAAFSLREDIDGKSNKK